jgi:hypothetical protein
VRRADNLTTFKCRLSGNLGASTSRNPQGLSRPVMGLLYLLCIWVTSSLLFSLCWQSHLAICFKHSFHNFVPILWIPFMWFWAQNMFSSCLVSFFWLGLRTWNFQRSPKNLILTLWIRSHLKPTSLNYTTVGVNILFPFFLSYGAIAQIGPRPPPSGDF